MSEQITKFILSLSEDPEVLNEFKKRPKELMEEEGLSKAEQAVVLSADPTVIRNAIDPEAFGTLSVTIVIVAVIIFKTGITDD
ncbi:MAG: hypothetical protein JAZ15_14710 [Candidatus Thiodiazotropha endolucinida]|nr:hypothetical protein [Candidatus Thiodiazotropha taylori]MCW4314274.1 hypothetical protein [Candidatus Thiodiazotropha taylori]